VWYHRLFVVLCEKEGDRVSSLFVAAQLCCALAGHDGAGVEGVCQAYPERVRRLFSALDLEREGLEAVRAAVADEDWPRACSALLEYYRTGTSGAWLRASVPEAGTGRDAAADAILSDTFSEYTISAKVPRRADGGLDWAYNGPDGDREWGWGLNRHGWVGTLLRAFRKTGNPVYVEGLDGLLRDWVTSNPYPGERNSTPQWRGLEVFSRVAGAWPTAFYALQGVPEFTPAVRILMLSSIPDHTHYTRHFHARGGNWIAMELYGLAHAAACWPEFHDADAWFDYASERLLPEVTRQVYPDGVQMELTSHYHRAALHSFDRFIALAGRVGKTLPEDTRQGVESMYNYLAYAMRPSGYGPLNNDSNLDFTRPEVLARVGSFGRDDWRYIATNGREGEKPAGLPSVVFPWAGQVIMRGGWDADAHWAFFDVGPLGIGHWHYDKLHLSVSAFGRDLLVDAGRYTYKGGPWRSYFVGSQSHNVILVDGCAQRAYAKEAAEPMTGNYALTPEYDYARGAYTGGYGGLEGQATHTRVVVYRRGQYWLVLDRVDTDRPRTIEALWHFHPDCTVQLDGLSAASVDQDQGNLRITPASGLEWQVEIVKGRTEPGIQGWWSRIYNQKTPSPCAVYTATVDGPATFAWILVPAKGAVSMLAEAVLDAVSPEAAQVRLGFADGRAETIRVPLAETEVSIDETHGVD